MNMATDAVDAIVPDSVWQSDRAKQGISGDYSVHPDFESLPDVHKVINTQLPHAVEQGVERGVFSDVKEARSAYGGLKSSISAGGWPAGTIFDAKGGIIRPNSVLVPVGNNGYAVYKVRANGTAELRTTLVRR